MALTFASLRMVFCMSGVVQSIRNQPAINPRLLPAIDQLLIAGIKLGPNKKYEAINKILKLVPEWKRGDCWRRIRQLRRTSALAPPDATQDSESHPYLAESLSPSTIGSSAVTTLALLSCGQPRPIPEWRAS